MCWELLLWWVLLVFIIVCCFPCMKTCCLKCCKSLRSSKGKASKVIQYKSEPYSQNFTAQYPPQRRRRKRKKRNTKESGQESASDEQTAQIEAALNPIFAKRQHKSRDQAFVST
eukprot:gb/GECG01007131.1/.p1 GENE.gb/GECG01007131.1/~~gb/GECG01007131.1/.p1  ORF type:complete len:114 (+),score=11.62 gb/GECG01007131.1/:1-342(+)